MNEIGNDAFVSQIEIKIAHDHKIIFDPVMETEKKENMLRKLFYQKEE